MSLMYGDNDTRFGFHLEFHSPWLASTHCERGVIDCTDRARSNHFQSTASPEVSKPIKQGLVT